MRTCVIGVGNELREDDGIGLVVLRELKAVLNNSPIELLEIGERLFDIPEMIMNFNTVMVLDALGPGSGCEMIRIVDYNAYFQPMRNNYSLHDLDLFWQLEYACSNGFCGEVILIGIATYSLEYRMELSVELIKSLPEIILKVAGIIQRILIGKTGIFL